MKQTAVEFQTEKIGILVSKLFNDEISKAEFHFQRFEICEQAKEIEREQQCYCEEDMINFVEFVSKYYSDDLMENSTIYELLEQFKNK